MVLDLIFTALLAVSPPQDPPPTALEDIVVEGVRRNEKTASDFVRAVSAPPFGSHTMAVWDGPLCLSVDNLGPDQTAALSDRILGRAGQVGVEAGEPGCQPNVSVIFTADGAATAADLVQRNLASFRPTSAATQLDRRSLARFTDAERPVRWWTVNMPIDGETGARVVALAGEHNPIAKNPMNARAPGGDQLRITGGPPWRLIRGAQPPGDGVRDALMLTVVVVDARLSAGRSLTSLGDYISMVVLAQVDPEAEVEGAPTILGLFSPDPTVTELSRWDLDYLKALYEAPVHWSHIRAQQRDIARRMVASVEAQGSLPD